jgi:ABC-type Fe2+-enterobactin transport system substrate-binding protein
MPPATDDVVIKDPKQSRAGLLAGYTVFLLSAPDEQYAGVCRGCGATVASCVSQRSHYSLGRSSLRVTLFVCNVSGRKRTREG